MLPLEWEDQGIIWSVGSTRRNFLECGEVLNYLFRYPKIMRVITVVAMCVVVVSLFATGLKKGESRGQTMSHQNYEE